VKAGFLFPGQGAQAVGMGRALAESYPDAKQIFDRADAILGKGLSKICWEGPPEELTRTEHAQPALYVTSFAALAALQAELKAAGGANFKPAAAAGLSLGEYTALAAAGAYDWEAGLKLVQQRADAMEAAARVSSGTMASVMGMEREALEAICAKTGAEVANLNAPAQIVISGPVEAVRQAVERARTAGAKRAIELTVGGAFHSRLMRPAAEKLEAALKGITVEAPEVPTASNVTGRFHEGPESIRTLLAEQLCKPVLWEADVRTLIRAGARLFLELGAGSVLKGLIRRIDPAIEVLPVGTPEEAKGAAARLSGDNA